MEHDQSFANLSYNYLLAAGIFMPCVVCGFVGILFGEKLIMPALIVGAIAGVTLAEYIRRKIGLDVFFSRIYSANQTDKKTKGS